MRWKRNGDGYRKRRRCLTLLLGSDGPETSRLLACSGATRPATAPSLPANSSSIPGKLKLRGEIASKEADAASSDLEAIRRRVTADVKTAFFEYWFYDKAIQTTLKDKDLLTKLSQIAEARYRVGKGVQQDVLRSQVEISSAAATAHRVATATNYFAGTAEHLLARSPEAPLNQAENIERTPLNYSLDDLYNSPSTN